MAPYRYIAVLLLFLVVAPQGDKAPDLASLSDSDLKAAVITLERTHCYGSCPAYTVTIRGDGRVQYSGQANVKTKGAQDGQIDAGAVKALMKEFVQAKYFSIADQYSEGHCACKRQCTDMPSAITGLTVSGFSHRVNHYYGCGCAPRALFDLESAIDKAAQAEQWTGDTSKQGPFGTTCFGG